MPQRHNLSRFFGKDTKLHQEKQINSSTFVISSCLSALVAKLTFQRSLTNRLLDLLFDLILLSVFTSCDFLFGSRKDNQVDQIFAQGRIDPNLVPQNVGYVPIMPIWSNFSNPVDIFVGYDEMIYVVDDKGLNILDLKGTLHRIIPIYKARDIIQDRRIHTYVTGKVKVLINGQEKELACIYHLKNTATAAGPVFVDTLIHPFCDASRKNIGFRNDDLQVEFTGLAVRADNILYVSRTGPVNDLTSFARPDNTILFFDETGKNTGYTNGLNPVTPNLKSVLGVSSIAGFVGPPQKLYGVNESHDFILCQASQSQNIEYRVLWIKETSDPDAGTVYGENPSMLNLDHTKADGFLYDLNKFKKPEDIYIAPDQSGYIFVVDSGKDSLYVFTNKGYEGVNPPANSTYKKNIIVSFGGTGHGIFQFKSPSGVCYYKQIVYVADKGNNRIMRYRLNTDLE